MFEKADIISINATYTQENVNMISSEQLDKLKPNAIIVNTARQEFINKDDLYNAIIENKVSSVAMDGFYKEPITDETNDDYLRLSDDKFIITPHNAYNSKDAVFEMERMLTESLLDVLNNQEIRNRVSV